MSGSDELTILLRSVFARLSEHERRLAGMNVNGRVAQVDHGVHKVRLVIGQDSDGNDVLSPWVAYAQTAGALKLHNPPTEGQTMVLRSPSGDLEQAVAEPLFWSDGNAAISDDGSIRKLTFGDVSITLSSGGIEIAIGETRFSFTSAGYLQSGGRVEHNEVNIGDDHEHSGVRSGSAISGPPTP